MQPTDPALEAKLHETALRAISDLVGVMSTSITPRAKLARLLRIANDISVVGEEAKKALEE